MKKYIGNLEFDDDQRPIISSCGHFFIEDGDHLTIWNRRSQEVVFDGIVQVSKLLSDWFDDACEAELVKRAYLEVVK